MAPGLERVSSLARTHAVRGQEPDARRHRRRRRRRRWEACEEESARDGLVGVEDERRGLQSRLAACKYSRPLSLTTIHTTPTAVCMSAL